MPRSTSEKSCTRRSGAGWQAALANVTSPAALAVIESCFDLWLREEVGRRVLGLQFRRRYDLPKPNRRHTLLSNGSTSPQRSPSGQRGRRRGFRDSAVRVAGSRPPGRQAAGPPRLHVIRGRALARPCTCGRPGRS